jgi:hypothetical protein
MIIVAIHGILSGQTDPSWPDHFDAWVHRRGPAGSARVLKKEYVAGPFPRWNHLVLNPRLAAGLANELILLAGNSSEPIWFLAHSNGANIALLTAGRLIARGTQVAGLLLTGAACPADIERNRVRRWLAGGQLRRAIAFCSREDRVLPGVRPGAGVLSRCASLLWSGLAWPYGALGRTGWILDGQPVADPSDRLVVRWYPGGHCRYFAPPQREATFSDVWKEVFHDS